jgi:MoxR-like ATPase
MGILRSLDIYGWEEQEDLLLASLVPDDLVVLVMMGESGTGKTWAAKRIAQAFDVAYQKMGRGNFQFAKLDGATARDEDFLGYLMPPTPAQMDEARQSGTFPEMQRVFSPNTIAFADMLLIDELTRIKQHMQSPYLPIMDFGELDKVKLRIRHIWCSANPPTYVGTEPVDEALANRCHMIVQVPNYKDMDSEDRLRICRVLTSSRNTSLPRESIAVEFVETVDRARKEFAVIRATMDEQVGRYVDGMIMTINEGITALSKSSFSSTNQLQSRRAGLFTRNILAVHAVSRAKGRRHGLKADAIKAFLASLHGSIKGEDPIPMGIIQNAHTEHSAILASEEDRVIVQIEQERDPVARVAAAIKLNAGREVSSAYLQQAYDGIKGKDDFKAAAFSYALLSRMQKMDNAHELFNRHVLDPMVSEVMQMLDRASSAKTLYPDLEVGSLLFDAAAEQLHQFCEMKNTPIGRVAIAITHAYRPAINTASLNPMQVSSAQVQASAQITATMMAVHQTLRDYVSKFGAI